MSKRLIITISFLLSACGSEITEHGWSDSEHVCREDGGVTYAYIQEYFSGGEFLSVKCNNGAYYEVTKSGWLSNKILDGE